MRDPNPKLSSRPLSHRRFDPHALLILLTLMVLPALGWTYYRALKPITLTVDQQSLTILSNQMTVAGVLNDQAIPLAPEDIVTPSLDTSLAQINSIRVRRALPLEISADGDVISRRTQAQTIGDALRDAGVLLKPSDRITLNDAALHANDPLARPANANPRNSLPTQRVAIQRAIPILVDDNGARATINATASTLGDALRDAGYVLYLGDAVTPDLGMPLAPGWQVFIRRSKPVTLSVDGRTYLTRTRAENIRDLLRDEEIILRDKDYSEPKLDQPIRDSLAVTIMRVREQVVTESESIPYDTVYQGDAAMEIDERLLAQVGVEGVKKRNILMRFENGKEVRRTIEREWIDAAPTTQIFTYGTKVVRRELTLPNGQVISYWRKIRMLATSYTAATSGKTRAHPAYGITASGMIATIGIVAIDPRVINLRSRVYVPGYGLAIAGDTGGGIKGKRIDLAYDEWNLVLWLKWVDIYVLDPPPAPDQIDYIIPDTPRERVSSSR